MTQLSTSGGIFPSGKKRCILLGFCLLYRRGGEWVWHYAIVSIGVKFLLKTPLGLALCDYINWGQGPINPLRGKSTQEFVTMRLYQLGSNGFCYFRDWHYAIISIGVKILLTFPNFRRKSGQSLSAYFLDQERMVRSLSLCDYINWGQISLIKLSWERVVRSLSLCDCINWGQISLAKLSGKRVVRSLSLCDCLNWGQISLVKLFPSRKEVIPAYFRDCHYAIVSIGVKILLTFS
jgi:hypothetical protein